MSPSAQPHLSLLNEEQILLTHQHALRILAATGVRIDSPATLRLLAEKASLSPGPDGRVRFPAELVEWAIHAAPHAVQVYDRLGAPAFCLARGEPARFGIGVTALFYQDPASDDRLLPFGRQHMQDLVRLGSRLPHYDAISTVGILQDTPPETSDLLATLETAANTTKPLVLLISEDQAFPLALDLLETLSGRACGEQPFVLPYLNPLTPLVLNAGTLDKLACAVQRGLPAIFSSYSMVGMSTPLHPAGTLALLLAEQWAGLAVSQLLRPGAPLILSMLPAYFDMQTMISFYDPQSFLIDLACAEIMAYFGLPHCGTSGSGTGWGPDFQAWESYWLNHLVACLSRGSLVPFVGDTLGAKAFSPVSLVYVHEIIGQARRFASGFALDETAFALEEVAQAGPGGDFLLAPSTLAGMRQGYYRSPFLSRWSLEKWQAQGCPPAMQLLREHTRRLLDDLPAPPDYAELMQRGEAFIRAAAA
jgi:trimethylamine--corrinoid protein Co-methyltransferase